MTRSPLASLTAALRTRKSRDGLFSRRIEGKDDQSMSAKSETRDFLWFLAKLAVFVFVLRSRSEEHTSELQSLMRSSYAVFCLKKKHTIISHAKYFQINSEE